MRRVVLYIGLYDTTIERRYKKTIQKYRKTNRITKKKHSLNSNIDLVVEKI